MYIRNFCAIIFSLSYTHTTIPHIHTHNHTHTYTHTHIHTISTQMAEDERLHPAFVSGNSSESSVIFSPDGVSVLACSQPLAPKGEGSKKFALSLFKSIDGRQILTS